MVDFNKLSRERHEEEIVATLFANRVYKNVIVVLGTDNEKNTRIIDKLLTRIQDIADERITTVCRDIHTSDILLKRSNWNDNNAIMRFLKINDLHRAEGLTPDLVWVKYYSKDYKDDVLWLSLRCRQGYMPLVISQDGIRSVNV